MSIICYTGLPGDGKSYSAVENFVIPALKAGRHVAHNLMLNPVVLSVVCERDVTPLLHQIDRDDTLDQLIEKCPPGAAICLDEVWRYVPAGTKVTDYTKDQIAFFKEHRHRTDPVTDTTTEILIIDQDPKTGVTSWLRALIELTYIHTKLKKLGFSSRFRVDVYSRAQSAERPSAAALIRQMTGQYRPEVWNCYISHTQSSKLGEAGLETSVDGRATLWGNWRVRAAIVAALALPFLIWASVNRFYAIGGHPKLDQNKQQPQASAQQASKASDQRAAGALTPVPGSPAPAVAGKTGPKESERWRFAGLIQRVGHLTLVALAGESARVITPDKCRMDAAGEWTCMLDGELIAAWTGPKESGFQALFSAAPPQGVSQVPTSPSGAFTR